MVGLAAHNLNHLVALQALLSERNVSRAAEVVGVSQSAMSHTLRALRLSFDDPLLVRVGNQMVLTEYAEDISQHLHLGMKELSRVVNGRAAFRPELVTDEFVLSTLDGIAAGLLPHLWKELRECAPNARLRLVSTPPKRITDALLRGDVDAAVLPPTEDWAQLCKENLVHADVQVLARKDHPGIKGKLSLARFCALEHAMMTLTGEGGSFIDQLLAQLGKSRRVVVRVAHLYSLPELIESSNLIAVVPRPVATFMGRRWGLVAYDLPMPMEPMPLCLYFHERFSADPANRFFRAVVAKAARNMDIGFARRRARRQ